MKTFFTSACVLLLASAVASASSLGGTDHDDWISLDRELDRLAQTVSSAEHKATEVSAWIKTDYSASDDVQVSGNDLGGFNLQGARAIFAGKVGDDMEYKLSFDGATGAIVLKDAYGRWKMGEHFNGQMGNMKSPFLFSSVASDEREVMYDRTTQGSVWNGRELGFRLDGTFGPVVAYAAAQNGGDTQGDELLLFGKVMIGLAGETIPMKQSGGFGTDSPTRVTLGAAIADEGTISDGQALAAEAIAITGRFFLHAEIVDYGDGFVAGAVPAGNASKASGLADTTPFGATAACMITEKDEAAVRYEVLDDTNDSDKLWLGYTRYLDGHAYKWQVNWITTNSDAGDSDILKVGLTVII